MNMSFRNDVDFRMKFQIKSKKKLYIILAVLTVLITFIAVYFMLMPLTIESAGFRVYLILIALLWASPLLFQVKEGPEIKDKVGSVPGVAFIVAASVLTAIMLLSFFTSPMFLSREYRDLINVRPSQNFAEEVELSDTMLIPTVDEALAVKLGEKKLGDKNLGSQFRIGDYNIIEFHEEGKESEKNLYWIAPIEYRGLFQWLNKPTTPGYALVNACNQDDVRIIEEDLPYVSSAFLWDNLDRKIYFENMFRLRSDVPHLELDNHGNPVYVQSVLRKKFAFFGGLDNIGVIVTDARTGESAYYDREDAPDWIDHVVPASLIDDQLDNYGAFVHGFWNSVFARKDVLTVSSGINFIYSKDSVYLYTGMTSVGADDSIVGMSLTDMRTKQSVLYKVSGATEAAAARSALGKVQEKRYTASDPVLINYKGEPTYFILLKDNEGLVKQYAYVNVSNYTLVAVNESRAEALAEYAALIRPQSEEASTLTILDIQSVVMDGNTVYLMRFENPKSPSDEGYIADFDRMIFRADISLNPALAFLKQGSRVQVKYFISDTENLIKFIEEVPLP